MFSSLRASVRFHVMDSEVISEEAFVGEVVLGESSESGWWESWVAIASMGFWYDSAHNL